MAKGMFAAIHRSPLVDEELADQVWQAWSTEDIDDATAFLMWLIVARLPPDKAHRIAVKPISDIGPGTALANSCHLHQSPNEFT